MWSRFTSHSVRGVQFEPFLLCTAAGVCSSPTLTSSINYFCIMAHTWLPRSNLPVVWADRFYSEGKCRLGGLGDLDVMSQCKSLSGQKDAQSSCNQQWDSKRDRCETGCSLCYRQTKFKVVFLSVSLFPVTYILLQWRKLQIMRAVHLYIIPMIQKLRLHTAPNTQFQTDFAPFLALKKTGYP